VDAEQVRADDRIEMVGTAIAAASIPSLHTNPLPNSLI
jgi:hypothetical protein